MTTPQVTLIDMRDILLRVAQTYCPNHDDGVQITAAPLWSPQIVEASARLSRQRKGLRCNRRRQVARPRSADVTAPKTIKHPKGAAARPRTIDDDQVAAGRRTQRSLDHSSFLLTEAWLRYETGGDPIKDSL
jgi:hypothetical protein